jgi:hypothetical protein
MPDSALQIRTRNELLPPDTANPDAGRRRLPDTSGR